MYNGQLHNVYFIINHHHHHCRLAKMELGHLLTRSGLTRLEVSLMASPGCFFLLVCSFLSILGNLLQGILFICCNQFIHYSCIFSKTGVISYFLCNLCVCFVICASASCFFSSYIASVLLLFFLRLLLLWYNFHYRTTKLVVPVNCILSFLFSLNFSVF